MSVNSRRSAGELEAAVLAALWAGERPLTPRQVQQRVGGDLARTTVATILARLHEKGTVSRTPDGRGYAYAPTVADPAALTARRMHTELDRGADRSSVLARFASDLSPADGDLLRALLDQAGGADTSSATGGGDRGGESR